MFFSKVSLYFFFRWYLKAQQLNPKNGRPYNQLALLAHYAVCIFMLQTIYIYICIFLFFLDFNYTLNFRDGN